jgi:uncharacterized protein (TIGR00251 family)
MPAWTPRDDGIMLAVRVTPRAARDGFTAGTTDHFAARLTAPPVEGAANTALIALVAKTFGVPKRHVALISGDTGRLKRLLVTGDGTLLAKIAASLYEAAP